MDLPHKKSDCDNEKVEKTYPIEDFNALNTCLECGAVWFDHEYV